MKVGDLVTLSVACLQRSDMRRWRDMIWFKKKPVVGIIVRKEKNPTYKKYSHMQSENQEWYYYIRWNSRGPASRWGNLGAYRGQQGYFLRKDLKFVRKGGF